MVLIAVFNLIISVLWFSILFRIGSLLKKNDLFFQYLAAFFDKNTLIDTQNVVNQNSFLLIRGIGILIQWYAILSILATILSINELRILSHSIF